MDDGYFDGKDLPAGIAEFVSRIPNLETLIVVKRLDGAPLIVYVESVHVIVSPEEWYEVIKGMVLAEWESKKVVN